MSGELLKLKKPTVALYSYSRGAWVDALFSNMPSRMAWRKAT